MLEYYKSDFTTDFFPATADALSQEKVGNWMFPNIICKNAQACSNHRWKRTFFSKTLTLKGKLCSLKPHPINILIYLI